MMRLNYEFYTQNYGGNKVPQAVFEQYVYRAGILLDSMIRTKETALDAEKTQRLMCELCDRLYDEDRRSGISRESLDGYDVTYDSDYESCEIRQIVRQYLGSDGVLFRGRRL
ncbi:MAG: hypothetical protein IKD21_06030 [Clostridia bacterium]|nr:hypothetical protein [Clostridia bacterium]